MPRGAWWVVWCGALNLRGCFGRWFVSSGVQMNTGVLDFPADFAGFFQRTVGALLSGADLKKYECKMFHSRFT